MGNKLPAPSRFFTGLFRWFCDKSIYTELQGDLLEEFYLNAEARGLKYAKRRYILEVTRMIRPSVIKKVSSKNQHNYTIMLRSYTVVALRSLSRNRLFSSINILGLAMSMAIGLLTISFISETESYDQFHEQKARIYRVNNIVIKANGEETVPYASTSLLAAERIRQEVPGVEKVASFFKGFYGDLEANDKALSARGFYANEAFFEVFTFPLIYGNPQTALSEPYSIVLTESTANKIFGRTDVFGEIIIRSDKPYKITGIAKDPPHNSHIKFDALGSEATLISGDYKGITDNWKNMWSSYAYLLVNENHNLDQIQSGLDRIATEENEKTPQFDARMRIEQLSDIFPGEDRWNEVGTVMPKESINSILVLTLIVIFSACFNYANLSIARSLKRAKEVGIRKVVGAKKFQVISQFIAEAIIVSFIALLLAFFIFQLIRPEFLSLNFYIERTATLSLNLTTYFYFFLFAISIGICAGLIPAVLMSRFKPLNILKGINNMKIGNGLSVRKVLIGSQFVLSMGFAILVSLTYKQYQYALHFDLGYSTENILNIALQENDYQIMKSEFEKIPEVKSISGSTFIPSTGSLNSVDHVKVIGQPDSLKIYTLGINDNYLENHHHNILAGQSINNNLKNPQIVVNQAFVKAFDLGSNEEAIGRKAYFYQQEMELVGIVEDFHYGTLYDEIIPFAFIKTSPQDLYFINLKLESADVASTMQKIDVAWQTIDQNHELSATFFEEDIQRVYKDISSSMKTYGLLALIAISISLLGLLGMAVYTAEIRLKELTIRKVLGAGFYDLMALLSKNFFVIIIISTAISIPLSINIFKKTVLEDMEYTINVGFGEISTTVILVLVIAVLTIGSQVIKATRSNSADNLRNE